MVEIGQDLRIYIFGAALIYFIAIVIGLIFFHKIIDVLDKHFRGKK